MFNLTKKITSGTDGPKCDVQYDPFKTERHFGKILSACHSFTLTLPANTPTSPQLLGGVLQERP